MRTSRKAHVCCECGLPIRIGERHESSQGVWPGIGAKTFRTCMVCVWFRSRVEADEREIGCSGSESIPPFTGLLEAMGEAPVNRRGYGGVIRLEMA